jgi:hypothetical protein
MELHHIIQKADRGEDTFENCIPLRFDCHSEMMSYDPIEELDAFVNACEDPSFEFLDADLEGIRVTLQANIEEFLGIIAYSTFPVLGRTDDRNSVPDEWASTQPQRYRQAVGSLHKSIERITDSYDSLVRLGRRNARCNDQN